MKCKDCKWWKRKNYPEDRGICSVNWVSTDSCYEGWMWRSELGMTAHRAESLVTYHNFGCPKFEERLTPFSTCGNGTVYYQKDGKVELLCQFMKARGGINEGDGHKAIKLISWLNEHWKECDCEPS